MKLPKLFLYAFTLTLGVGTGFTVVAWTGPTGNAPNNNAAAPLNVSATAQSKAGGLVVNTGGATNGLVVYGNVGINTASPSQALSVEQDLNGVGGISITNTDPGASAYTGFRLFTSSGISGGVFQNSGTNAGYGGASSLNLIQVLNAPLAFSTSNLVRMKIDGAGIVRIGTQDAYASSQLVVNSITAGTWAGIFNYYNNAPPAGTTYGIYAYGTTYAVYANGPVYGSAFYYTSDQRLKKNIETIANSTALQDVLALNPVTFNWIAADKPKETQIGFIAQEVEKIAPALVLTDPDTKLKAVDYARVVPLLTGAIQAQQKEIDELKAEVEALKASK